MVDGEAVAPGSSSNQAQPFARIAGMVAYGANLIIFLALIISLLVRSTSPIAAIVVWLLAIAVFILAAGLTRYAADGPSPMLTMYALAYSLIASSLLFLIVLEPSDGTGRALGEILVLLLLAITASTMGVVTAPIAGLPLRRLAIPLIIVVLGLVLIATLVVLGLDLSLLFGDSQVATLGRLLVAIVAAGLIVAWLLAFDPSRGGPFGARLGVLRRRVDRADNG